MSRSKIRLPALHHLMDFASTPVVTASESDLTNKIKELKRMNSLEGPAADDYKDNFIKNCKKLTGLIQETCDEIFPKNKSEEERKQYKEQVNRVTKYLEDEWHKESVESKSKLVLVFCDLLLRSNEINDFNDFDLFAVAFSTIAEGFAGFDVLSKKIASIVTGDDSLEKRLKGVSSNNFEEVYLPLVQKTLESKSDPKDKFEVLFSALLYGTKANQLFITEWAIDEMNRLVHGKQDLKEEILKFGDNDSRLFNLFCEYTKLKISPKGIVDLIGNYSGRGDQDHLVELIKDFTAIEDQESIDDLIGNSSGIKDQEDQEDLTSEIINFTSRIDKEDLIWKCIENGNSNLLKDLVKDENLLEIRDGGNTTLHKAALLGNIEAMHILMDKEPQEQLELVQNDLENTPLHYAASKGNHAAMYALINKNPNIRLIVNNLGDTAIHNAARNGDVAAVFILAERGGDILTIKNNVGEAAIHKAAYADNPELIEFLNRKCPNEIEAKTDFGETPLHLAALKGNVNTLKALIKAGAKLSATDFGETPLHLAASEGNVNTVKALIEAGSELSAQNDCGDTALHLAARLGSLETVKMLVDKDPKLLTATNTSGNTAYMELLEKIPNNPNPSKDQINILSFLDGKLDPSASLDRKLDPSTSVTNDDYSRVLQGGNHTIIT